MTPYIFCDKIYEALTELNKMCTMMVEEFGMFSHTWENFAENIGSFSEEILSKDYRVYVLIRAVQQVSRLLSMCGLRCVGKNVVLGGPHLFLRMVTCIDYFS